ncbi:Hypothetical_protein [Hexamita inflata]|uniref:Hypothetical_protein n=1 Tax=Hexamita inflata TaxID=28002 RepID=A0AA86PEG6_9EUKA|nr:Hypothetical protein HINF_LOCUS24146 [Hexamita inflata]
MDDLLTEAQTMTVLFRNPTQILDYMEEFVKISSEQNEYEFICPGFKLLINDEKCYCSRRARVVKVQQNDIQNYQLIATQFNEIVPKTEQNILPEMFRIVFENVHSVECKHHRLFCRAFNKLHYRTQLAQPEHDSIHESNQCFTQNYNQLSKQQQVKQEKKGLLRFRADHRESSLTEEKIINMLLNDESYYIYITLFRAWRAFNQHWSRHVQVFKLSFILSPRVSANQQITRHNQINHISQF